MKLSIFALLFASTAFANDLDKAVARVNADLQPKAINEVGYDVDYRQESVGSHLYTWVNISQAKQDCRPTKTSYLKDGKIVTVTESGCHISHTINPRRMADLYQIECLKSEGKACIQTLAKELTTEVVKLMIEKDITRVYVK